jgi:hypothetical protein
MMTVVIIGFVLVILSMWHISAGIQEVRKQLWNIDSLMWKRWGQEIRDIEGHRKRGGRLKWESISEEKAGTQSSGSTVCVTEDLGGR